MNRFALIVAVALTALGCAPVGVGGKALTFASMERLTTVEGRLVGVRCYLQERAPSEEQTFCAETDARGNLPLGLLDEKGRLTYLTAPPSSLASLVSQRVEVRGLLTGNHQLLRPVSVRYLRNRTWNYFPL